MEQRTKNLAWGGALALGPALILAGVFWSRIDARTNGLGLANRRPKSNAIVGT